MADKQDGCVKPAAGPLTAAETDGAEMGSDAKETMMTVARVGRGAPDFEATAYIPASGDFQPVKLSDYRGKWITLCFYPGDFTFV